jgi:RNA polymerase sigma-70 factor (ECF subfamily)
MNNSTNAKQLSDEELAAEVAAGTRGSFEELVCRYSPRLFHFLRHRLSTDQDIEDLIQETFLKAYRNIDRYNPDYKFSTWMYTVAVRLAISHFRANKPKDLSSIPNHLPPDPQEIVTAREQSQKMWSCAKSLRNKQYEVLWLRYMEDLSVKEIAVVMNRTHVQIRVLLHRARLNLAKEFKKSNYLTKPVSSGSVKHKYSFL